MESSAGAHGEVDGRHRWWWGVFVGVTLVHLGGQLLGLAPVHLATKPLLMPTLLAWFLSAAPAGRLRTTVAVALVLSWLGDLGLLPDGDLWFLLGLGAFLLAQLTYGVAFWPWHATSVLGRRRLLLVPYLAVLGGLLWVLWPHLDDLRVPVTAYAVVIVAMAVLATGLGAVTAIGAVLFVLSDSLIALTSVAELVSPPRPGFWVMLTYTVGQAMLARGSMAVARSVAGAGPG